MLMLQIFYDKYPNSNLAEHMKTGVESFVAPLKGF